MRKRLTALLLALVMCLSLVPTVAFADGHDGQVRVIVENTTYAKSEGAPWDGKLVDEWVAIDNDSTMMSCVVKALGSYTQTGAESGYISEINGLAAFDGGSMSGWMGTLNDWFTNEGFGAFTVANGKLSAGDEIRLMYSLDYGEDCGGSWNNNDKTVKSVIFSDGTLDKPFDKNAHDYTLTVPADTTAVTVTPTASNKNYQVRTYVGTTEYKRTAAVPVENGTVITVKCGDPAWPTMNDNTGEAQSYTFTVAYAQPVVEKPSFDMLNVQSTVLVGGCWVQNETYQKETYSYDITLKSATVSLMLAATTKYDTEKYTAVASYQNADGQTKEVAVNNAKSTTIAAAADLPFGQSTVTVTISAISDPTNKTEYVFHVTRPRDETKTIKSKGITLLPVGRNLSAQLYQGQAEGTMFKADTTGTLTSGNGVSGTQYNYRTYVWDNLEQFALSFTGNSAYAHLRYSTDDGAVWSEAVQESGITAPISFPNSDEGNPTVKVIIQVLDDKTYAEKGFDAASANTYTVWVERVTADAADAQILTAETQSGDWYPAFTPKQSAFTIVVPNGTSTLDMIFTVSKGATVKVGTAAVEPTEGKYTITLKTSAQTVSVTSAAGITNKYSFKLQARSAKAYADAVADYLPINSQYTNTTTASNPEKTLAGNLVSLGNWGGYITYYFEDGLTDNPNNKYGMDFYAYGNAFASGGSAAENGQVWVSEDGNTWYALAGSEHYEDDVLWDYQVTYTKTASGKTAWTDNQDNSNDGASQSGAWVNPDIYYLSDLAKNDTITLQGIVMYSQGGTIRGDSSTGENSFAHAAKFGYVDYFGNGTVGADVNPYIENPVNANGFDLAWAVDAQGNSVDVSEMAFHYVKVVTASNIWAGAFAEKSTESAGVLRTTPQETAVGKTAASTIKVNGTAVDTTKPLLVFDEFTVSVDAAEGANVYINNQRATEVTFKEIPAHGMIRVIVQEGDKEAYVTTFAVSDDPTPVIEKANDIYTAVGDSLLANAKKSTPVVGSIGGEWMILGLARSGKLTDEVAAKYYANVTKTVEDRGGVLHDKKYTEYSRVVLGLTAAGYDPTNVAGYDLTAPLTVFDKTVRQGNNGTAFGLIALNSHDYHSDNTAIRQQYVNELLSKQLENGGWKITTSGNADPDMTAMAIQALAPYYDTNASVKEAVDKALAFLSENQGADGDYGSSETCAQVVVALSALGIDAAADRRFIKGGTSVLEALCSYYAEDATYGKGFAHVKESSGSYVGGAYNGMATEQCYYALTAYERFKAAQNTLYNMSDVTHLHSFADTLSFDASGHWYACKDAKDAACAVTLDKKSHTPVADAAVASTCTKTGLTAGSHCADCSYVITAQTTTEKKAHTYDSGKVTTPATCTATGIKTYTCTVCGDSYTETIPVGDHTYGPWETVKAASYTEEGLRKHTCTVCGQEETAVIPKHVHSNTSAQTGGSKTKDDTSPRTGDSGIILYAAMSVMSLVGMGWVGKRRSK